MTAPTLILVSEPGNPDDHLVHSRWFGRKAKAIFMQTLTWFQKFTHNLNWLADKSATTGNIEEEICNWTGTMENGTTLRILNIAGNIDVTGTAERNFSVTAVKRGEVADLGRIDFEVVTNKDETMIRVFCRERLPRSSGAHVHFTIKVPRETSFIGQTRNGNIEVADVMNAEASSHNGFIRIENADSASAQTRNGQIDVSIDSPKWQGALRFRSHNGGIRIKLPQQASAELEAWTSNGWVSTEFPLVGVKQKLRNHIHGMIGVQTEGRQLVCECSNGNVRVVRAPTV